MHSHDSIDRVSPTKEPDQQVVMYQSWHHLLFLHWEVPANELQALLPPDLTVDLFEGKAYLGLIPFTVTGVRPILLPALPGVSSFDEVNVRTYVHYNGTNPGVWFFSLDANSRLAVEAARAAYHLNYLHSQIDFAATDAALPEITLSAHRDDSRGAQPANAQIRYRPVEGPAAPAQVGTIEHFLAERYILYAEDRDRHLWRARVHHEPYLIQKAEVTRLDETLVWASKIRRPEAPAVRHYARGVDVKVYGPEKC